MSTLIIESIPNKPHLEISGEIALNYKWISKKNILSSIKFYGKCEYSNYLKKIISL